MKITTELRMTQYRNLYDCLFRSSFASKHSLSELLGMTTRTITKRLQEARSLQIIVGPETRKTSYANTLEYVTVFNAEDPDLTYWRNCEDPRVIYNAKMSGFCNSLMISGAKSNVNGEVKLQGPRSDYYMPLTPDRSWEHSLQIMREKISNFDPDTYTPRELIGNHWRETVKWDDTDETLYRYFKYNLRKEVGPIVKEKHIPRSTVYNWLKTLDKRCTIRTSYYPEGLQEYDTYFYIFDTEYEDFIVELFSELPASPSFFKVADSLLLTAYIPRRFMRNIDLREAEKWFIPLLEMELVDKGIVKKKKRAAVENFCGKEL